MSDMNSIPRREFLRRIGAAAGCAGGVTAAAFWMAARSHETSDSEVAAISSFFRGPLPEARPEFVVAGGGDGPALVRAALEELGGMKQFVGRGDRVLLKPNVAFDRHPSLGATTSPEVVAEVVRCCREAGARDVVVTDNPINAPEGCFRKSGIGEAVVAAGGRIAWPVPGAFGTANLGGDVLGAWPVFRGPLDKADVLIGIPTAKVHNLCGVSLAMKNWYGFLGEGRNRLHQDIHAAICDLARAFRPTLVILDGTRLLVRHGPTGGSPSDVRPGPGIAVSSDAVAIDALGCSWLGLTPDDVAYVRRAEQAGVGTADWRALRFREIGPV